MRRIAPLLAAIAYIQAGVPATAAPARYIAYRTASLAVELPAGTARIDPETFRLLHDRVATQFTIAASTPHLVDRIADCGGRAPAYRVSNERLFAYSCLAAGRIKYHMGRYGRTYRIGASDSTELIEFDISYPVAQRAFWDTVVAHVGGSLRFRAEREYIHG